MTELDDTADGLDLRSLPQLLAETIDVEARLRAVKAAAAESRPAPRMTPTRDQLLVASAGAVAALVVYLRWRARRPTRGPRRPRLLHRTRTGTPGPVAPGQGGDHR
jgi:hypothetical protein